jgi:ABC-type phosphate transport system substrate-binding protein
MTHELTLFHVYEQKKIEAARRLKELKDTAGDAARVLISAPKESAGLLEELNVEYVTDACLVMVNHTVVSQTAAIGGLIAPPTEGGFVRTELAMVEAPLSAETVKVHGQRLKEVNPQQLAVGARGTVIIVHSLNKLDSLTLDQVKAIFGKKLDDWRLLEASQSNLPIRRYGPSKFDLAANIFYDKVLPWAQCTSVDRKDTPVEVIAAVGADTQGIGFVSITDAMDYFRKLEEQAGASTSMAAGGSIVPAAMVDKPGASGDLAGKPSIKILAIGPKGSAIVPDRKTVNDGSYPLSSPLTLYVSPKARETAKNFADFFVTRDVHSILLKYGIVPSFTADERERQSVLAKRQADEEAKLAAERARWESMFTETKLADDFHADVGQWDDTCGFARADLGDGKFAFQAQPAKAAQNAMNRQGLPAGFQLDMNVQIKFGAPGNQNGLTVHFLSKPSTAGGQLNWGTGYSLLIVDDVANKGLRLFRPELDDKKRVVKPAVQLGQKVTMVDGKTHRLRIISEGDGKIHVFWDDMARPVISLDEGGKFQGADGTSLGLTVAPGVGATVSNVTVKSKKASP